MDESYLRDDVTATGLDLLQIAYSLDAAHRSSGVASPVSLAINLPQRTLTITASLPIDAPAVGGPAIAVRPTTLLDFPLPTDPTYG